MEKLVKWKLFSDLFFRALLFNYCFDNFRYDVMYVYLYDYAESDLKFKSSDATLLLSMIGILNTVGEVLVGKKRAFKK